MSKNEQIDPARAREHAEPVEQRNPVPRLFGLVAAGLCVWGVSYFLLNPDLEPAKASPTAGQVTTPQAPQPIAVDGAQIFDSRCAACHQSTGLGLAGVFPPLAGSEWVNGDAATVARILLLGINGTISVKGATYNGTMPPFGHQLTDAEIAAVASYSRTNLGNKSSAMTADVVKAAREKLGTRAKPWAGGAELQAQR